MVNLFNTDSVCSLKGSNLPLSLRVCECVWFSFHFFLHYYWSHNITLIWTSHRHMYVVVTFPSVSLVLTVTDSSPPHTCFPNLVTCGWNYFRRTNCQFAQVRHNLQQLCFTSWCCSHISELLEGLNQLSGHLDSINEVKASSELFETWPEKLLFPSKHALQLIQKVQT